MMMLLLMMMMTTTVMTIDVMGLALCRLCVGDNRSNKHIELNYYYCCYDCCNLTSVVTRLNNWMIEISGRLPDTARGISSFPGLCTGSEAHTASYSMAHGLLPQERETDYTRPSRCEIENG
jgi:hypothetical protein